MLNRKLLEVLRRFTPLEKNRLRQFLLSPYFNGTPKAVEIIRLYDLITAHNSDENNPALAKAEVFRQFFPDRTFEEKAKGPLDSLTTELFGLVRRFLLQKERERESSEVNEHLAMAKFYRKYAIEEWFWQSLQQARKEQEGSVERDAPYFFNQFKIEEEEFSFRTMYNSFEDDANLYAVQENLDKYYSILKMGLVSAMEYQKHFTPLEDGPSHSMSETVLKLSQAGGPLDLPINRIYRLIMSLTQNSGESQEVEMLERLTTQYRNQISPETYKNMMAYQRSTWVKRYLQSGQKGVSTQVFDLYRAHLEEGYFYFDHTIMLNSFYNLTILALKLGEFDWAKKFLKAHPPERICGTRYPDEIHSLCTAEYLFALKKYVEAENTLVYRLFENTFMSISADVLLIKIYYENQNELLGTRMKALDQKIRRTKYSTEKKETYLNFLRKLDKIIKYGWQTDSPRRAKLVEEIKAVPGIVSREWLLEKLA